ncbi:hypothetical protein KGP36_01790 [Patescibacteria group bacterium]|nr:hypothetical protein [Patescibacteria group bacterium]
MRLTVDLTPLEFTILMFGISALAEQREAKPSRAIRYRVPPSPIWNYAELPSKADAKALQQKLLNATGGGHVA